MSIELTLKKVREAAQAEIEVEGADFVYPLHPDEDYTCMYVLDGKPDCLVGRILHRLGVPLDVLSACEGSSAIGVISVLVRDGTIEPPHGGVESWLKILQEKQDAQLPWGECVTAADAHLAALA